MALAPGVGSIAALAGVRVTLLATGQRSFGTLRNSGALRVSSCSCTDALWCYGRQPSAACQQVAEQASGNADKQSSKYVYRMVIPRVNAGNAEAYRNEAEPSCQLAMRWGQSDGEPHGARDVRARKTSA